MTNRSVVVAIDGSATAERAVSWAAAEAASLGTSLRLVHAFAWPLAAVPRHRSEIDPGLAGVADQVISRSREIAQELEPDLDVEAGRIPGFLTPVMIEESRHAQLLVIGSRGLTGALGTTTCSTALDLAAAAYCPIVVIRPDHGRRTGGPVVVGHGGSPASTAALALGTDYAERHHAVLRVVNDCGPAEELLRQSIEAQLIVLGARGCGGFEGQPLGSVSQTVLHQASCPVAVIPPAAINRQIPVGGPQPLGILTAAADFG